MGAHVVKGRPDILGTITFYCTGCEWEFNAFLPRELDRARKDHMREADE